jgi:hypothetical protein
MKSPSLTNTCSATCDMRAGVACGTLAEQCLAVHEGTHGGVGCGAQITMGLGMGPSYPVWGSAHPQFTMSIGSI